MIEPVVIEPDIIPYSVIISPQRNNDTLIPAIYSEHRNQAFLKRPNDYYMAVTGVRYDTSHIPFMRFPSYRDSGDPTNPNLSDLYLELVYSPAPASFQNFVGRVNYVPFTNYPPPVLVTNNSNNRYYNIFDPNQFIQMVNNAINFAFDILIFNNPGLSPTVRAPYFSYNDGLVILNVQNVINPLFPGVNVYDTQYAPLTGLPLYDANQPVGTIQIKINSNLKHILGNFKFQYTNNIPSEFLFLVNNLDPKNTPTWYEFESTDIFLVNNSPIARLAILSNSLPVVPTQVPLVSDNPQGIPSSYRFVFDLYEDDVKDLLLSSNIQYNQMGYLRLYDLISETPLYFIDLQFVYIDHQQNVNIIDVTSGNCCAVSLVFIKKELMKK